MSISLAQLDAYRRTLSTHVVACEPIDGGFAVRLAETICYATGGGQPADRGTIGDANVLDVYRDDDVVHLVDRSVSGDVSVAIDWTRRYDLMQQHTAQHLVTAIAHDELGLPTLSFHLGDEYCAIELACEEPPSTTTLQSLAERSNAEIRAARTVSARTVTVEEYATLPDVRSRGLPADHVGDVRLVEIAGLDLNTCGGTHVSNTAELQMIRLGRVEKTASGARLHYFAGGRVIEQLKRHASTEASLTALLTCAPADFSASVEKLQNENRRAQQQIRNLGSALASYVANEIVRAEEAVLSIGIPTEDLALLNGIANEIADRKVAVLVGDGVFLVCGPQAAVDELGPRVRDALGGRGGGRRGRFQGKHESPDLESALANARAATL